MSVFDELMGNWIMVNDEKNSVTIEDFPYDTGVTGEITKRHCEKCVSVNNCWFKNAKGKKPEPFNYTGMNILDSILNGILPGLYHFRCHCKESPVQVYDINQIELIIPEGKIDWLFADKSDWVNALGYNSKNHFLEVIKNLIKQAYFTGSYEGTLHNNYGYKINLLLTIPGGTEKQGKEYKIKSAFMIFPNGKLKCNTLIGGWQK